MRNKLIIEKKIIIKFRHAFQDLLRKSLLRLILLIFLLLFPFLASSCLISVLSFWIVFSSRFFNLGHLCGDICSLLLFLVSVEVFLWRLCFSFLARW